MRILSAYCRCCRIIAFLCLLLLVLVPSFSVQQQNVIYLNCLRNTTSTSLSSTFTRNLNSTLSNFATLSSQGTKYDNLTAGSSGQDMVYAVFQCRGDLSVQSCGNCVQNAIPSLQQGCPKSVGARIRPDGCFLRYDNQSFFTLDTDYVGGLCNTGSTNDVTTLTTIGNLMDNVTSEAPKQGGWASASESGMYAAAQCLGYLSQSECSQCLSSSSYRSCDSALGAQVHLASCDFRYEAYNFLEAPAAPPPSLNGSSGAPPPAPAVLVTRPPSSPPGPNIRIISVSVVVGFIVVVGALCAILVWRYKTSKIKGENWVDKSGSRSQHFLQTKAQLFSLEELEEATDNFHSTNKLGQGGFGIVYKGTLSNGEHVAIKKLSLGSQQGKQEFLNEVNLITSVQHKNLIRLLGCCAEGPDKILVYEYLPNKSLDFSLSEARANRMLNWSTRYGIVVGMAKGLAYLHEESHIRIIHRDIKPGNILLDDQFNPVIADFGLARLVKDNATHVNTRVAGTIGYMAPEYALRGDLSEKVDTYSFGIVSLEIITGKQNAHSMLLAWVWEKYQHGKVLDLVDARLGNSFSPEQVIRVVHVALLCTQENPKERPTMSTVLVWLFGTADILQIPSRPTFLDHNDNSTVPAGGVNNSVASASTWISGGVQSLSGIVDPR